MIMNINVYKVVIGFVIYIGYDMGLDVSIVSVYILIIQFYDVIDEMVFFFCDIVSKQIQYSRYVSYLLLVSV